MAWRDNLVPASFRGVGFQVAESENKAGGRRIALHEYPGRDVPFAEDMGEITKTFSIEGYIVGDDYLDRGERLIDACNMPGPGELVHPYRGSQQVVCHEIVESVSHPRGAHGALHDGIHRGWREPVPVERRKYRGGGAHARKCRHPGDH